MARIEYRDISIEIEKSVIELIETMRQDCPTDNESGGMLIGSILTDSSDFVIRDYTFPLKGDHQSRYKFIRKKQSHNALLQEKWEKSNRTVMYFGEWHTHPEAEPNCSQQDIRNWETLLHKSKTSSDYLVFIIGGINFYKVWIGCRQTKNITLIYKGAYNEDI
ncbi:hypothetical protein FA950_24965 [Bacillus thuringiensis]|uniref:Mov34/MPN/PAD-1 family protein n=1 Tax=Bacillus thuringiensis TaxID=1428 RepID=UPI000BF775C6|nr:Mov34/MPN/PAD-1 family protein [Bacillus thuringiensis]PFF28429.1 hypothetical protein CN332_04480 [Bacillus thuringiensis]TKA01326.1 hypothetical protein FA950_24965 [Bacillus thuringiensis]